MRPKSMVLILIALGCGLIASIGISQVVERNSNGGKDDVQTQPIFVAMADMDIGQELNAQSVKLEEWPVDRIPEGAVTDAAQIEGMSPNQRLFAGEPLLARKLIDINETGQESKKIKKGYRVVSVKVDMASSVSYLITPGDHVDVMAFSGAGGRSQAEVILSNIEVFAINSKVTREVDNETGGSIQAKTVSLLVTPSQQTKLMAHSFQGRINLSLRRPDEEDDVDLGDDIVEEPVSAPVNPMPFFEPDFGAPEVNDEPEFVMEVLEGASVRKYAWDGSGQLPREISSGDAGAPSDFEDEVSSDFPFPTAEGEGESEEGGEEDEQPSAASRDGSSFQFKRGR